MSPKTITPPRAPAAPSPAHAGSVSERLLILVDIERLMTGPEMGLVEPSLQ